MGAIWNASSTRPSDANERSVTVKPAVCFFRGDGGVGNWVFGVKSGRAAAKIWSPRMLARRESDYDLCEKRTPPRHWD